MATRITAAQAAEKWGISVRRVQDLCRMGKIPGAERFGTHWMLPADAVRPTDGRRKEAKSARSKPLRMPRRSPMLSMTDLYSTPGTADKVSRSLRADPQAQALFDAGIAYARGEIDKVYDYARYFLSQHTGVYAMAGATMLLSLCAIWRGDMVLWNEAKHHIAEAPCRNETDREVLSLVLAAADSSVFEYRDFPEWFERGCFEPLPADSHPMAKVFYANWLYMAAFALASKQYELEGMHGLALMRALHYSIEPMISQAVVDKTLIPEIYLRLYCAITYHNSGDGTMAVQHLDRAIALALPDRLYGVLAVNWRQLDTLLEERLTLADPEAVKTVKKLYREFLAGQSALRSKIHHKHVVLETLTSREMEVAKLVAFGYTNKKAAELLGIGESTVKTTIQKIMQKTGLTDRNDFVLVI